jgi:CheY-like chemotaxis protein
MRYILVIDDDAAVRRTVERILVSSGFTVTTASDGRQGLARCKERRPDLVIITDILMPEMEGIETISRLRALYADLPILAMSGGWHDSKIDLLKIIAHLGATDILSKPFDSEELLRAIANCTLAGTNDSADATATTIRRPPSRSERTSTEK